MSPTEKLLQPRTYNLHTLPEDPKHYLPPMPCLLHAVQAHSCRRAPCTSTHIHKPTSYLHKQYKSPAAAAAAGRACTAANATALDPTLLPQTGTAASHTLTDTHLHTHTDRDRQRSSTGYLPGSHTLAHRRAGRCALAAESQPRTCIVPPRCPCLLLPRPLLPLQRCHA